MEYPPPNHLDLLIRGGHVIDPANGIDGVMDVGIAHGRIAEVSREISAGSAAVVVEAAGKYVTPGIIDMHAHVYPFAPEATSYVECVSADAHMLSSGVTTTVDAGTAGAHHFQEFYEGTIQDSCPGPRTTGYSWQGCP